ncbi:serine/threonine-protein kinase [Nocardia jejuensis]|uniref:serine/threonine-protein kinase n=1 Tax=Nocardia jejuensis TaxID=328049 RepID=UPI00082C16A4|nr:serine/threonine-protein kinase [Nocardia jejuensis]
MLRSGDDFAGYLIERELGRGGMGSVYLAKHPRLPRLIALKLLNRELFGDIEVRKRFEREGDVVARLDHPNIVPVFDRGFDDDRLWIAMRWIDGGDAAGLEAASLEPRQAIHIIAETGRALDYAHRKGILHRDVKPANILIERAEGEERVFLADFGIARIREESTKLTQTGSFTATLAYAAPEQLAGHQLDHRCDQYSLACTLFRLLTGTVPFTAEHPIAVMQGHLNTPPPPVSSLRAGLPPALDAVMARALAKHPGARFDSCTEFATAAQQALTAPAGPPPGYRYPPGTAAPRFSGAPVGGSGQIGKAGQGNGTGPGAPGFGDARPATPVRGGTAQYTGAAPAQPFASSAPGQPLHSGNSAGHAAQSGGNPGRPPRSGVFTSAPRQSGTGAPVRQPAPAAPVAPAAPMRAPAPRPDASSAPGRVAVPAARKSSPRAFAPRRKRKSRLRGCLLWLLVIIAIPLLVVAGIVIAYLDRSGGTGPSVGTTPEFPVETTVQEYAPPTEEETYAPTATPEPTESSANARPQYVTGPVH